ncbi:MAG: phage Gp37/Gp68 family protein [Melioribacteraceae bacterium]|nr:phage Gp37/Gp68 family protein [Melioribacteraceae bacterium]
MSNTKIEWANKVWNPVTGCNKVSRGCKNCYAEIMHRRLTKMNPQKYNKPFLDGAFPHVQSLEIPLHWKKPTKIFVNSMSDLFHPQVPFSFVNDIMSVIEQCPQHKFIILTKRPENALRYTQESNYTFEANNIWLGVSIEDQQTADERIPLLLQIPANIRFISAEPLIGDINLEVWIHKCLTNGCGDKIDWVIVGGESGKSARPLHPDWVRSIRDNCKALGIKFFFKQWGNNVFVPPGFGEVPCLVPRRISKKKAGRLLDGVEHNEFPKGVEHN